MKPIKLSLTAFGPYRQQEIIDFTELKGNQIFVISGTTGSGKTTIFDGICYALYGSVSGEDRDNAGNVRSDFAEDKLHTAIELIFEMKGKRYRILRQLAHVKQGNKTATGEKNEFVEIVDSQEIPVLDSHKIRDMNNKLEEIIGLTKEQFKQIVMLPQGEFQKLLTSDSQNKGEILRKIFKTESFKKMADRLRDKKAVAEKQLEALRNEQNVYIASLKDTFPVRESSLFEVLNKEFRSTSQIIAALTEELAYYNEIAQKLQQQFQEKKEHVDNKRLFLQQAQQFNKELQAYLEAKQRLIELQEQQQQINTIKLQVTNAEKAQHIIPYENAFRQQRHQLTQLSEQIKQIEATLENNKKQFAVAEEELTLFTQQQNKQDERKKQLNDWQRILPFYEEVTSLENRMLVASRSLKEVVSQQELAQKELQQLKDKVAVEEQTKHELQKYTADYEELMIQLTTLEKIEYQLAIKQQNEQQINDKQQQLQTIQAIIQQQKNELLQMESNWLANQAYVLAAQLVSGEPCPVCGSREHEKIHVMEENIVTKDQLDAAKNNLAKHEQQGYSITAAITQCHATIEQADQVLNEYAEINYNKISNKETILSLQRLIQDKQNQKQKLTVVERNLTALRQAIEQKRQAVQMLQQQCTEQQLSHREQQAILQEKRQQLPSQFATQQALVQSIQELELSIHQFDTKLATLQQTYDLAKKQVLISETAVTTKRQQLLEEEQKLNSAQNEFQNKVFEAGFADGKSYTAARLVPEQMENFKQQIVAFDKEHYAVDQQISVGREHFEEQQPKDIVTLQQQLNELITAVEQINQQVSQIQHRLNDGQRINNQLQLTQKNMELLELRAGHIIKLYELLAGKNEQKISFERYLQIEYLEQIIHAANERLIPLSNGQYRLSRSQRLDGNGKQSGLSLNVYDSYTGQERDVKTLSGGEQFNASLCLALGMSDIIQSFKGNVHMDTMFIDEGFGTLDEEALAKAIDTLVDLQKTGRMIGIISHVAELKDTIPATLEVKKTKEGFSHTRFVIK
ncbi:MAG: SMC family ATPase [Kurthia sp.]|nr:SMC family ATPase [Candidatus Kurthia equi]